MSSHLVFVGTYTDPALLLGRPLTPGESVMGMTGPTGSDGIHVFRHDPISGAMTPLHVEPIANPSFLVIDPAKRFLFAVNEFGGEQAGRVTSFALDAASGRLQFINQVTTGGGLPCHLALAADGKSLLVAHYETGSVSVVPVDAVGSLSPPIDLKIDPPDERGSSHAHYVTPNPGGRYVLATNPGTDRVNVYRQRATGELEPAGQPWAETHRGGSPRHLAFHPSGQYLFANGELDLTLSIFRFDPESGRLDYLNRVHTLAPADKREGYSTAEMLAHPNGRYVYVSNRGHNSIATIRFDAATSAAEFVGTVPSHGRTPRNFQFDPTGHWLYVANQDTGTIEKFALDAATGALSHEGCAATLPAPVCIQFS